jgi:hypothetical protein
MDKWGKRLTIMPAKTVKDLIAFNNSVPDEFKVKVLLESLGGIYLAASFIDASGETVTQQSSQRIKYYGKEINQREKGSEFGIPRFVDPTDKPMFPWGSASCKANSIKTRYKCNNSWFVSVTEAAKGYGPMLYDCLIVKLGESGYGLTADRSLVSPMAAKVWVNYLVNREDVKRKYLDLNHSTPEIEDDCYAEHEADPDWNTWVKDPKKGFLQNDEEHEKEKQKHREMRTAVQYAYFDDGIQTLNELKQAGLLVDKTQKLEESLALRSLYESFVRDIKRSF